MLFEPGPKLVRRHPVGARGTGVALDASKRLSEVRAGEDSRGHRFVRYADDLMVYVGSERAGQRVTEEHRTVRRVKAQAARQPRKVGGRPGEREGVRAARRLPERRPERDRDRQQRPLGKGLPGAAASRGRRAGHARQRADGHERGRRASPRLHPARDRASSTSRARWTAPVSVDTSHCPWFGGAAFLDSGRLACGVS